MTKKKHYENIQFQIATDLFKNSKLKRGRVREREREKNVRNKCDISSETGNKTFTSERISLYELHLMFKKQHDFEER